MEKFDNKLSIVMIAYNEERSIERVIRGYYDEIFAKTPKGSEFIIYLDGPKDDTPNIVKELSKKLSLNVIYCGQNKGYFKAAKTALSYAKNDYVFFSDSSGKHNARDFWNLASMIKDYDIVTGLRSNRTDTLYRRIISLAQRLFVSMLFFMPLYDYNTGFKLMRKKVIDLVLKECNTLPVTFSTELIIRAYKKGLKISNCPITFTSRDSEDKQFAPYKLPKIILDQLVGFAKLRLELMK